MGDPAKDYYQERLAQAAWGQISAAVGYPSHHGLDASSHSQVSCLNTLQPVLAWQC